MNPSSIWKLLPFYISYYSTTAVHNVFFSLYLYEKGLGTAWVGTMLSLAPLAAIAGQPVWSAVGDKAAVKRNVLAALAIGSAALMAALPAFGAKWYLAALYCAFSFFYLPLQPTADTIALESLGGKPFGPVRMSGTIAFALLAFFLGRLFTGSLSAVPFILCAMLVCVALSCVPMPPVKGHRRGRVSMDTRALLKCRPLLAMIAFSGLMMAGMSFYYSFFSIFIKTELGGTAADLGLAFLIGSMPEVFFLIFGDRLFRRMGVGKLLMLSASVMIVRWVLMYFANSISMVYVIQSLHCFCFLPMTFAVSKFINAVTPDSHKAAGQMIYSLTAINAARIFSSFTGGFISELFGVRSLFLCAAAITGIALLVFGTYAVRNRETLMKASSGTLKIDAEGKLIETP